MSEGAPEETMQDETTAASGCPPANVYLLCYAFNQDGSCFASGTSAGFRVYRTSPLKELFRQERSAAFHHRSVTHIAMLHQTSIFAMVTSSGDDPSSGGPHAVHIWDESKRKFVGELRSRHEVRGVALRRDLIAMICESTVYVYTLDRLKHILTVTTHQNLQGICAIAPLSKPWIMCCPGPSKGTVRLQVGADDAHVFQAHESALAAISVTEQGTLVATASEFGTVVKVFQRVDRQLLYRLRVGPPAQKEVVSCITFRPDGGFVAVMVATASSSTVHIFKLPQVSAQEDSGAVNTITLGVPPDREAVNVEEEQRSVWRLTSLLSDVIKGTMPTYFTDFWSCARFQLPDEDRTFDTRGGHSRISGPLVAFNRTEPKVSVLQYNGMIYESSFERVFGALGTSQECSLQSATAWFQVRPDFRIREPNQESTVAVGIADEAGAEGDGEEWQVL